MIVSKKNKKTNNKCQRKFKIKIRHIICIVIITFFTYTSFQEYDDLWYYKEELNYDIPNSLKVKNIYEQDIKYIYKHQYNEDQINYIKNKILFEPMRNLLVEYYIKYKFVDTLSRENIEIPDEIKNLLENEKNLYYYYGTLCDKALLIIDIENNTIYNFYNTCRG